MSAAHGLRHTGYKHLQQSHTAAAAMLQGYNCLSQAGEKYINSQKPLTAPVVW